MRKRAKLRLFAKIDDRDVELFSVLNRQEKGIVITPAFPKYFEFDGGGRHKFAEQHYSVHPSRNGLDTTLTQKTLLKSEPVRTISNVAYVQDTHHHLLWPLFARRVPKMGKESRILRLKRHDTKRRIGKYYWRNANMVYSVFIAKAGIDLPDHTDIATKRFSYVVGSYAVIVFVSYLNLPSLEAGDVVGWSTSPEIYDNQKQKGHFHSQIVSLPIQAMTESNRILMSLLRSKMIWRLESILGSSSDDLKLAIQMSSSFTNAPLKKHN